MLLWDKEFGSALPRLELLSPDRRYAAALTAIEWTLDSFEPPADPDSPAVRLLRLCLADARTAIDGDHTGRALPADAEAPMTRVVTGGAEPGIAQLVMAVANCYGVPAAGMGANHLNTVLSDCYAAVVEHEDLDGDTIEDEAANPACTAAIAWQLDLVKTT